MTDNILQQTDHFLSETMSGTTTPLPLSTSLPLSQLQINELDCLNSSIEYYENSNFSAPILERVFINDNSNNNSSITASNILHHLISTINNSSTDETVSPIYGMPFDKDATVHCPQVWDGAHCWPSVPANHRVWERCSNAFAHSGIPPEILLGPLNNSDILASRYCDSAGQWSPDWTDYTKCLQILNSEHEASKVHRAVVMILFSISLVSLVFLLVTLFIFFHFKSIVNCRVRVHRNLAAALTINALLLVMLSTPQFLGFTDSLTGANTFRLQQQQPTTTTTTTTGTSAHIPSSSTSWLDNFALFSPEGTESLADFLCKVVLTMKLYSNMATINWMFIEGLLLTSRITVSIFRKDAPYKLYHFIGWGLPAILVTIWAMKMSRSQATVCWSGYARSPYIGIIVGPLFIALFINCCFLVNIIRILMVTVRSKANMEITKVRKAIKATALLFPLLGLPHLLFCINPDDNGDAEGVYMIANAILQSSQGIFVAILYCFMDTDVRCVLRNAWNRNFWKTRFFFNARSTPPTNDRPRRSMANTAVSYYSVAGPLINQKNSNIDDNNGSITPEHNNGHLRSNGKHSSPALEMTTLNLHSNGTPLDKCSSQTTFVVTMESNNKQRSELFDSNHRQVSI